MSSLIAEQKGLLPTEQADALLDLYAALGLVRLPGGSSPRPLESSCVLGVLIREVEMWMPSVCAAVLDHRHHGRDVQESA